MRLFVALDIDDAIRERIARFIDEARGFAPRARWVRPESLHVTLKFIGERPEKDLESIRKALKSTRCGAIELNIRDYGFVPGPKAPRLFWAGIQAGSNLTSLAAAVDKELAALGMPNEEHAFSPHLTLARAGGSRSSKRPGQSGSKDGLQTLREKLATLRLPEFGTMVAREFFLYQSELSQGGSKYTKLAPFPLTGV
ncbi:MAG: RNA 2',3'-cyclic phosphodiesterase [Candidatus Sulfotelmatobacter sp.]